MSATNSDGTLETEVSKTQESSLVDGLISATDVEHLSAISRGPQDNTQVYCRINYIFPNFYSSIYEIVFSNTLVGTM